MEVNGRPSVRSCGNRRSLNRDGGGTDCGGFDSPGGGILKGYEAKSSRERAFARIREFHASPWGGWGGARSRNSPEEFF